MEVPISMAAVPTKTGGPIIRRVNHAIVNHEMRNWVLVVDDNRSMQRLLQSYLQIRGFHTFAVEDGARAIEVLREREPLAVLLDVNLWEEDGFQVCRQIRMQSSVPVIIMSGNDVPGMEARALECGADDYLSKSDICHLVPRIRILLEHERSGERKGSHGGKGGSILKADDLTIDLLRREVYRGQETIDLTGIEFNLLLEFASFPNKVLTYRYLLRAVWGESQYDSRPLHTHICYLRHKLAEGRSDRPYVTSIPGVGFCFRACGITAVPGHAQTRIADESSAAAM